MDTKKIEGKGIKKKKNLQDQAASSEARDGREITIGLVRLRLHVD